MFPPSKHRQDFESPCFKRWPCLLVHVNGLFWLLCISQDLSLTPESYEPTKQERSPWPHDHSATITHRKSPIHRKRDISLYIYIYNHIYMHALNTIYMHKPTQPGATHRKGELPPGATGSDPHLRQFVHERQGLCMQGTMFLRHLPGGCYKLQAAKRRASQTVPNQESGSLKK